MTDLPILKITHWQFPSSFMKLEVADDNEASFVPSFEPCLMRKREDEIPSWVYGSILVGLVVVIFHLFILPLIHLV